MFCECTWMFTISEVNCLNWLFKSPMRWKISLYFFKNHKFRWNITKIKSAYIIFLSLLLHFEVLATRIKRKTYQKHNKIFWRLNVWTKNSIFVIQQKNSDNFLWSRAYYGALLFMERAYCLFNQKNKYFSDQ